MGQLYVGLWRRALAFFLAEVATGLIYLYVYESGGFALNLAVGLWCVVDAYKVAKSTPDKPVVVEKTIDESKKYRLF